MVLVLLNFGYLFAAAFLTGFTVLSFWEPAGSAGRKLLPATVPDILMAGLAACTVYAQFFSLFAGVDQAAVLVLTALCIAAAVIKRNQLLAYIRNRAKETGRGQWFLYGFLVLLIVYGASRGYMHTDTGLYHAQSIRWIEEYGVVPGLGNLHSRFAYNSAAFPLSALFSMRHIAGQSMHCVPGFMALLVAVQCCSLTGIKKRGRVRLSDFAKVGAVYYLTVLFQEMVSPASDYFAMLTLWYVLIRFLELMERREKEARPYALLCLGLVFAMTLKLSAAIFLLLTVKPAVILLREKRYKEIGLYLGAGILIALPWLIRNVLISGWLFYPFTWFDVFPVDWKIEKGYADSDAVEIQVYARMLYDVYLYDTPFTGWAGGWFRQLKGLEKVWVLASAGSVVIGGFMCLDSVWKGIRNIAVYGNKQPDEAKTAKKPVNRMAESAEWLAWYDWLLYEAVLIIGYFFWQFSAPLIRYGYIYVVLLPMVTAGACYILLAEWALFRDRCAARRTEYMFFAGVLLLFLCYKSVHLAGSIRSTFRQPYYFRQQDYGDFPADTYEVDGVTVYVPLSGGQIGYNKFPSSPIVQEDLSLRGKDIRSGFRKG